MFKTVIIAALPWLLVLSCAGKDSQQETTQPKGAEPLAATQETKDPCEDIIGKVALQARKEMKTVKESCQDLRIEANPMWNLNYDGTVRIRVYDASGKQVKDEFRKIPNI